jgi:Protein of unknown function (DUF4239)
MIENIGQAPVWAIAAIVFCAAFILTLLVYWLVFHIGRNINIEISPGFFTPVSVTFGLIIGFLASQVWSDNSKAISAVMREASALKTIISVSEIFPEPTQRMLDSSVNNYIDRSVRTEWPAMQKVTSYHGLIDYSDNAGLREVISITPQNESQSSAKQQLLAAYTTLYEARSERLLLSGTSVNPLKWLIVNAFAVILMLITALVHRNNKKSAITSLALLSIAISLSYILILAHDRPFTGYISISPDLLLSAKPKLLSQ